LWTHIGVADVPGDDAADRRREVGLFAPFGVVEVVLAFDRDDRRQADRERRGLVPAVVLGGELKRLAKARPQHDRFEMFHHPVAKLEADVGAVVEAKQIAQLRLEAVVAQVLVEPVREMKIHRVRRERQRRRQVDGHEVRLERPELGVVVIGRLCGRLSRRVGRRLRSRRWLRVDASSVGCGKRQNESENGRIRGSDHNAPP
jgi:hypothetical protein